MWSHKGDSEKLVRRKRTGQSLLFVSFAIWVMSLTQIYLLSNSAPASLFSFAVWGGILAGVIGTLRSFRLDVPRGWAWYTISLTRSLLVSGLLYFILGAHTSPADTHWVSFFFGLMTYMVTRDVVQTITTAVTVAHENRRNEARLALRNKRLAALAAKRGEPLTEAVYPPATSALLTN